MNPCASKCRQALHVIIAVACCMCVFLPAEVWIRTTRATRGDERVTSDGNVPVLTYKYDAQRTGGNTHEKILTINNVNEQQFGLLMSYPVDGQVYAQPLYVPNVSVGNQTHNLVIIATEHDTVYAFDADRSGQDTTPLWRTSLLGTGNTTVPASDFHCGDLTPEIGITSTPVIDSASGTLFVVSYVDKQGKYVYALHALALTTGRDKSSPERLQIPGGLDTTKERQRAGLLFANGRIYFSFSSYCDHHPYHGIILGYSYDGQAFSLQAVYNDTPDGGEGGIWGGGSSLAADKNGYIYAMSGNGTFDLNRGGRDAGDSFIQLTKNLRVMDYFTPYNQHCLSSSDLDLGSGGPLLVPGSELIGGGKEGRIYVINTHTMGHFRVVPNPCGRQQATNLDAIVQELPPHTMRSIFSTPAYWNGPDAQYVFFSGVRDHTRAFKLSHGRLSAPVSQTPEIFAYSGGNPVISSNGTLPGTGILWLIVSPGELRTYDATDLNHELYHSNVGLYNKFSTPIVTNGKVFVPTQDSLKIYGLLARTPEGVSTPTPVSTGTATVPSAFATTRRSRDS